MSKTYFTLSLVFISVLLFAITPAFANDCDPNVDYNTLGHQQYEQGEYSLAAASFTCELQADPEAAQVYNARGNAYRNLADYVNAIADYDKAIEIDEEYAIAYNNRGWAHFKLEDKDQALEDYNKALEIDPDLAYAYNNRGLLFLLDGKEELATADFNRAIELGLPVNWAEYNLDLIPAESAEATPEIEADTETTDTEATDTNSELEAIIDQISTAENNRDWAEAIELYTQALEMKPDYDIFYYYRGRTYAALDQHEEAFADFTQAVELDPDEASAYRSRALAAAELGDFEQANADATTAYEMDSATVNNFYIAGAIAALSGDPVEAGEQFQQILDTYSPTHIVQDPVEIGTTVTLKMNFQRIYELPFDGEAGQTLTIEANSTEFDPLIILLDVDGNPINGDDDSGPGYSAHIRDAKLPDTGTYILLVSHAGVGSEGEVDVTITTALND